MRDRGQIDLTRVDCDDQGFVDPDAIRKAIRPSTRLIVVTHASNVLGTIQDAATIVAIARSHGVLFCLDAAQTAGIVPISVPQMNVDLLAFPGHKSLLGPTGTGGLYVGDRCPPPLPSGGRGYRRAAPEGSHPPLPLGGRGSRRAASEGSPPPLPACPERSRRVGEGRGEGRHPGAYMSAWREGGTGGDSATPTQPPLYPYYLEGGTPNTVGIAGLSAALDYLATRPMSQVLDHEQALVRQIIDRFAADQRFTIYGSHDPTRRVGTVSLNIRGLEAPDVAAILDDSFQIAVRPGLHCAPYIHHRLGTFPSGTVRISPGPFNTQNDLATLLDALDQIAGSQPRSGGFQ
jgi:cysteine desulfurase / selenocysteine lyase